MIRPAPLSYLSRIEDAFLKLQQTIYVDNNDLVLRRQLAGFLQKSPSITLPALAEKLASNDTEYFGALFEKIRLRVYPKSMDTTLHTKGGLPLNFMTNKMYTQGGRVTRVGIFCEVPIELHIISVMWLSKFGGQIDARLHDGNYGNRLVRDNSAIPQGRALYIPYTRQYQRWWSDGISAAKTSLDKGDDVSIVSFDLKDYFHRVELDFKELESWLDNHGASVKGSFIHRIFKRLHIVYAEVFNQIAHPASKASLGTAKCPLPIGLLSSSVLANWYLRHLDDFVTDQIKPLFYGRYVDDILIVMNAPATSEVTTEDQIRTQEYFRKHGRKLGSDAVTMMHAFISAYFSKLFKPVDDDKQNGHRYALQLSRLQNLELQEEKIFVYQFDAELSPGIVNKFVEEQKKRSSEFRFLSDEEDENFEEFDKYFFEDNFDMDDLNKAKFKKIEENKFKLSVYLAKLIQRKMERGPDYKPEEVEKVGGFFKGAHLIKNYLFWEKLFTLYLVSLKKQEFISMYHQIAAVINQTQYIGEAKITQSKMHNDLYRHAKYAMEMALGLQPLFLNEKELKSLDADVRPMRFRKRGLIRKKYTSYPLLHLSQGGKKNTFSLFNQDLLTKSVWTKLELQIKHPKFTPHGIRFFEAALFIFFKKFHVDFFKAITGATQQLTDDFFSEAMLDEAFELFVSINTPGIRVDEKRLLKAKYFVCRPLNNTVAPNVKIDALRIDGSDEQKDKYRVALVNKYVDHKHFLSSLAGTRTISKEEVEVYYRILDSTSEVKNLDFFMMPELALPHRLLYKFIQHSAKKQYGCITGIEHINFGGAGFNFVLTCMPVLVGNYYDAIPILRLKNHYSPDEIGCIHDENLAVAQPSPYRYSLVQWRGLYLSTYYCFELANIFHRILFYGKVDVLCAPVWNKDIYYYNNIVESVTRDLHCYMLQVNTSQYGDTRVTRPTDQVRRDKAKIKGGTVDEYPFTLLVSDIEIKAFREFQLLDHAEQRAAPSTKTPKTDIKPFKPTPPDFPRISVQKRIDNELF